MKDVLPAYKVVEKGRFLWQTH